MKESVFGGQELKTFVYTVVNGIAVNVVRLYSLGIRNIIVMNLPYLPCIPREIRNDVALNFGACSTNTTFVTETALHDSVLQQRVRMLNHQLKGLHVVIADQTKALYQLFYNGSAYGEEIKFLSLKFSTWKMRMSSKVLLSTRYFLLVCRL